MTAWHASREVDPQSSFVKKLTFWTLEFHIDFVIKLHLQVGNTLIIIFCIDLKRMISVHRRVDEESDLVIFGLKNLGKEQSQRLER